LLELVHVINLVFLPILIHFTGVAQGIITGIRGLCNGLGPALFGFIFYLFHVDLEKTEDGVTAIQSHNGTSPVDKPMDGMFKQFNEVSRPSLFIK